MKILISDIQHLTDARYFSSKEVEYLGFGREFTASNDIKLIQEWIYGPQIVSEFSMTNCLSDVHKYLDEFKTDVIHFNQFFDPATINEFSEYEIFFDINIEPNELRSSKRKMEILADSVDYFILKSSLDFDVISDGIKELITDFPCFIDARININDIKEILTLDVEGLVLRGGEEERVGVKSFDELDEIFDLLNLAKTNA